ncbi:hypothetical protein NFHSH190041_35320 [Shewanella sp. NFH-SH190041]|uniref:helix-turn-helix transcriptional regulator n=1 Tax=Shewanella sp. NFH-SH190041 TaxID=2950245 RepID=UPI0021C44E4C|nr:AlpA family transcriptional regulator [Shewanella sp. NFH-SH190041]BDM66080.1 hypothetical protein NFHSH190041_35320 [Shewanella sp. NFH-SH190041]
MNTELIEPQPLQLLKIRQVMAITALPKSTLYKYCSDDTFPKPVHLGPRNVAWVAGEVQAWIRQKMEQRR